MPVSLQQIQTMVNCWLKASHCLWDMPEDSVIKKIAPIDVCGYYVYLEPSGIVVVSADNDIEPIITFLPTACDGKEIVHSLRNLLHNDLNARIRSLSKKEGKCEKVKGLSLLTPCEKWQLFLTGNEHKQSAPSQKVSAISEERVPPLLRTVWGQKEEGGRYCYNYFTPHHYP